MIREERIPLADLTESQLEELYWHIDALRNRPVLRDCLMPGCLRQYDSVASLDGDPPARPAWSSTGWKRLGAGSILPTGGDICPDHADLVTAHWPRRVELPSGRWSVDCACGWSPTAQRWHKVAATLWEEHLLTAAGRLPPAPPIPDPEHRLPLAEHNERTLAELYDRLEDAEADREDIRAFARSCYLAYSAAVPALLGAKTALEALHSRMAVDSRDWGASKADALLYAVLVGWNCEDTTPGHVHNDIDCSGDQALWDIARQHDIPADQTIQISNYRWWIANAIKAACQIEASSAPEAEAKQ